MLSKSEQLNKLDARMSKCSACVLRSGCKQIVFGEGNPETKIMFIGEAPGQKEAETGLPFIGSSGRILDKMLTSIKIKREAVYLTNICKCRPPENRDPLPEEIQACWPWLEKQIAIIDPKIIITLGKYALNCFLPSAKISEAHGQIIIADIKKLGKINLFPLYHPAAARQNKKIRALFNEDFRKIPKLLKKLR